MHVEAGEVIHATDNDETKSLGRGADAGTTGVFDLEKRTKRRRPDRADVTDERASLKHVSHVLQIMRSSGRLWPVAVEASHHAAGVRSIRAVH